MMQAQPEFGVFFTTADNPESVPGVQVTHGLVST